MIGGWKTVNGNPLGTISNIPRIPISKDFTSVILRESFVGMSFREREMVTANVLIIGGSYINMF